MIIEVLLVFGIMLSSVAIVFAVIELVKYVQRESVFVLLARSFPGVRGVLVDATLLAVPLILGSVSVSLFRDIEAMIPNLSLISDWVGHQTVVIVLIPVLVFVAIDIFGRVKKAGEHDQER